MSADRNLLFGILAVQLDFVSQDELMAGMNAWLLDKAKPLGAVLRDLGHLPQGRLELLDALVAEHLKKHGDDPKRSLAALSSVEPVKQALASLADADVQGTLQQVGVGPTGTLPYSNTAASPSGVRYRIVRPHARGALGEVFVAEDTELGRNVALKEIQGRHADDRASRSRFVLEAEITGGLEHPGIVPVYGLGTYSDGRPFYAMRFIQGDNLQGAIKRFHAVPPSPGFAGEGPGVRARAGDGSDPHPHPLSRKAGRGGPDFASLEFRDLLRRFVDVCNAIAYAHARGVLHRDLKPGNIMLGQYGETLVVDWGLAKATGRAGSVRDRSDGTLKPRSAGDSSATVAGHAMGTPAYMSPEQAAGRGEELGPPTDVYALGATLYELLCGRVSVRGSSLAETLERVRTGRFDRPRAVLPAVPPALEAVCLKAMALNPGDRYAGAQELAKDVERWLADEAVTAYPEPLPARTRRWIRKHARLVSSIGAALAVGVVALGGFAWQRQWALVAVAQEQAETAKQRDAKEAARLDAVAAGERAEKRARQVERMNEILGSIFVDLDPKKIEKDDKPLQAVLGERLDRATAEIEGEVIGDALTVARMQVTLGKSQLGLGYADRAIRLLAAARATLSGQLGPDHPDTLTSMNDLALGYQDAGNLDAALPLLEQTLRLRKAKLGPEHPSTLSSMNNLAEGYRAAGKPDAALPLYEEAVRLRKAKLGPEHPDTLTSMGNLALGYYAAAGKFDAALPLLEETLRLKKAKFGPAHPDTLATMNNLASGYSSTGKLDLALPLLEETLRLKKAKFGPEHPDTLASMNNLASGYQDAGRPDAALPLYEETLRLAKGKLGPEHPDTLTSMNNLALAYSAAGKSDAALPLYEEALRLRKAKLGPEHPSTLSSMNNLALGYHAAGKLDAALPLWEEALKHQKAKLGPDHPDTLASMNNLAAGYRDTGNLAAALPLYEETLRLMKTRLGPDHPDTLTSMGSLAKGYCSAGRLDAALPLFEQAALVIERRNYQHEYAGPIVTDTADCLERLQRYDAAEVWRRKWLAVNKERSGPTSPAYAADLAGLGLNLLHQRKWPGAEMALRDALGIREKQQPDAWTTFNTRSLLGASLLGQQKLGDAEPLLLAGYSGLKQRADRIPPAAKHRLAEAAGRLVRLYESLGRPAESAEYLDEMWAWADVPPAK